MKTKTPIWIRDKKTGKIELIPYRLMQTFADGTRGFNVSQIIDGEARQFYDQHQDYFEFVERDRRVINVGFEPCVVFLGRPNRSARQRRYLKWFASGVIALSIAMMTLTLLCQDWVSASIQGVLIVVQSSMLYWFLKRPKPQ